MIEDDLVDNFEDPMIVYNHKIIFIMLSQTKDHVYIITNPHEDISQIEIDHDQNNRFTAASQRTTNLIDISDFVKSKRIEDIIMMLIKSLVTKIEAKNISETQLQYQNFNLKLNQ